MIKSFIGEYYVNCVSNRLYSKYNYKSYKEIPGIEIIELVIDVKGVDNLETKRVLMNIRLLELVTGRKPHVAVEQADYIKGKRQLNVKLTVVLRGDFLYRFLDYLVYIMLPVLQKRDYGKEEQLVMDTGIIIIKDINNFYNLQEIIDIEDPLLIKIKCKYSKRSEIRNVLKSFGIPI